MSVGPFLSRPSPDRISVYAEALAGELLALPIRRCMPDEEIAYITATVCSSRTS
jgi:hypothetical protein